MKILVNALSAKRGGGQTYLVNLLSHLNSACFEEIIVLAPATLILPENERIKRMNIAWPCGDPLLRATWEHIILPRLLRKLNAKILFCPGGLVNTSVPEGCQTVTMFRNMIPFDPTVRALYPLGPARVRNWLLERAMLKSMLRADLVIFISEFARKVIETRAGRRLTNAVTIPHGINEHFRIHSDKSPPRPKWLPPGEYLLYVSIFETYKHQREVVRAFAMLCEKRLTDEILVLAGQNDLPAGAMVREEVARLGLEQKVIFAGAVPYADLPALYAHAKINLFASTCENCPNILLEALAAGRPLLVSNVQPMPEFGGDAVIYFNPRDPSDFARQAMTILDNPEELERLGRSAAAQSRKYDWADTASRTWNAIKNLVVQKEMN